MNEQERKILLADLKAEVIKEITGKDLRVAQSDPKPLKELYNQYKKPLYEKYGIVTWATVWDCIRKLVVYKMGHRYVRDLLPSEEEEAAEIAEVFINMMLDE